MSPVSSSSAQKQCSVKNKKKENEAEKEEESGMEEKEEKQGKKKWKGSVTLKTVMRDKLIEGEFFLKKMLDVNLELKFPFCIFSEWSCSTWGSKREMRCHNFPQAAQRACIVYSWFIDERINSLRRYNKYIHTHQTTELHKIWREIDRTVHLTETVLQ